MKINVGVKVKFIDSNLGTAEVMTKRNTLAEIRNQQSLY
jgi:hypothetical protein